MSMRKEITNNILRRPYLVPIFLLASLSLIMPVIAIGGNYLNNFLVDYRSKLDFLYLGDVIVSIIKKDPIKNVSILVVIQDIINVILVASIMTLFDKIIGWLLRTFAIKKDPVFFVLWFCFWIEGPIIVQYLNVFKLMFESTIKIGLIPVLVTYGIQVIIIFFILLPLALMLRKVLKEVFLDILIESFFFIMLACTISLYFNSNLNMFLVFLMITIFIKIFDYAWNKE